MARSQATESPAPSVDRTAGSGPAPTLSGEDAAAFDLSQQSIRSWSLFVALLSVVLGALYVVWIQPGVGLADDYLGALQAIGQSPEVDKPTGP